MFHALLLDDEAVAGARLARALALCVTAQWSRAKAGVQNCSASWAKILETEVPEMVLSNLFLGMVFGCLGGLFGIGGGIIAIPVLGIVSGWISKSLKVPPW